MKTRFRLFQRASGVFYIQDTKTLRQESLKTKDKNVAQRLFQARNAAHEQPALNLQLARTYLAASDPAVARRTWQNVMDAVVDTKKGVTRDRWHRAVKDHAFDDLRERQLLETRAEHLLNALKSGTVATNVFLRRLHNFAVDLSWLPWPLIPKRQWPAIRFGPKRAITFEEHTAIVEREGNPERKAYYELLWHLGGAQGDTGPPDIADDLVWMGYETLCLIKRPGFRWLARGKYHRQGIKLMLEGIRCARRTDPSLALKLRPYVRYYPIDLRHTWAGVNGG